MSGDDGWWARRLGHQQPPPQQQPNYNVPGTHRQQQPQQYPVQPQQFQPQPQPYPQQQQQPSIEEQLQHVQVTPENFKELSKHWKGGKGMQEENHPCPECGGGHYYSRSQGARRGPTPAPHCFDCGYNGLFEQADQATWQAGAG